MSFDAIRLLLSGLNHLLRSEPWAPERLRAHRGAHVALEAGPVVLRLCIDGEGLFQHSEPNSPVDVTLQLPADAPVRLLFDREGLFAGVRLSGAADVAETLGFVFRNLDWDAEGDLAAVIGDIPARRLVMLGKSLGKGLADAARKIAENLAEYSLEEARLIVPRRDTEHFSMAVASVESEVARLEQRIAALGA